MKKCDYLVNMQDGCFCIKSFSEMIWTSEDCNIPQCYSDGQTKRRQKLNKINEKGRYNGSQNEKIGNS